MKKFIGRAAILIVLAAAVTATGVALATPGSGSVTEVQARGTIADPFGVRWAGTRTPGQRSWW